MADYQVLFSGEVCRNTSEEQVRSGLARELGIDERKARQLFSGRTVVIKSQLQEDEARTLQQRLETIGALCRIKSLAVPNAVGAPSFDKDALRLEQKRDQTLHDITAAHIECPRCSHLQLETSHCARCGVDIAAALVQQRKEDLLIEKKLRELRAGGNAPRGGTRGDPRPDSRPDSRNAPGSDAHGGAAARAVGTAAAAVAGARATIRSEFRSEAELPRRHGFVRSLFRRS